MKNARILKYLDRIRSSFWFLPALLAVGAVLLSYGVVTLEEWGTSWLEDTWGWKFTGGAEGASAVLETIAGSMITIAGVVFSMILVVLSLASSQLGPRLLSNFMRDTPTQVVLGTFVGTFLYCLHTLRTLRREEGVIFVPHLAVSLGVLLSVVSVGVLIYFIHHVSISIQANEVVSRVGKELRVGIDRIFPTRLGEGKSEGSARAPGKDFLERFQEEARQVEAVGDGYLQIIDQEALLELATEEDVVLRLERHPGDFVVAGRALLLVWPGNRADERFRDRLADAFVLGNQRTTGQDLGFSVSQLVEVAVRALSTGVNDPFTAVACVDQLGAGLSRLAQRDQPSPYRYDDQGQLRVIAPPVTFSSIIDTAFDQIRQHARSSAGVTIRLLETIAVVAASVKRPQDRVALLRQARMIVRGAQEGLPEPEDRRVVEERYRMALAALDWAEPGNGG